MSDMIMITRAQFKDAVKHCVDLFGESCPEEISEAAKEILTFVITGWAEGLEMKLFDDEEDSALIN